MGVSTKAKLIWCMLVYAAVMAFFAFYWLINYTKHVHLKYDDLVYGLQVTFGLTYLLLVFTNVVVSKLNIAIIIFLPFVSFFLAISINSIIEQFFPTINTHTGTVAYILLYNIFAISLLLVWYRFRRNKNYTDVPVETIIKNSKNKAIGILAFACTLLLGSVWCFFYAPPLGFMCIATGIAMLLLGISNLKDTEPKIILNNDGLEVGNASFYTWDKVSDEDFYTIYRKFGRATYFKYNCPDGSMEINISPLNIDKQTMQQLLTIYRMRHNERMVSV